MKYYFKVDSFRSNDIFYGTMPKLFANRLCFMTVATLLQPAPQIPNDEWTIAQLIQAYESLLVDDKDGTQLTIKKQKLEIIQATERQLKKVLQHAMSVNLQEDEVDAEEGASALQQIARNIAYYFLILFGLFQDIAGSFIFGTTLFGLIPGIAQPFLTIAAIIYTALDSILFYAFEVSLLKDALGIPYSSNNLEEHIDAHRQQLKLASTINDDLSTLPAVTMDPGLYEQYTTLAILFNQDLRTQDAAMSDYQESVSKTILKVFLVTFGALSSIAASYFWADSIMSLWAASIIGTPIGWAMIALTVIAGLGYYYAMGGSSMVQLTDSFGGPPRMQ